MVLRLKKAALVPLLLSIWAVAGGGRTIVQDLGPPRKEHKTTVAMVPQKWERRSALWQWRTEGVGVQPPPPPEIPKALQNRAKLNPIVKTVKNWWI